MKNFKKSMPFVLMQMRKAKAICFMFDFDGTLSAIASTPQKAVLSKNLKKILEKISAFFDTVVISGREVKDLKEKIGINNIIYAGSQGLEWQIGKRYQKIRINKKIKKELASVKKEFKLLLVNYKNIFIEDKGCTFTVHYRLLKIKSVKGFLKEAEKIVKKFEKRKLVYFLPGKKSLDVRPNIKWNKGTFAIFLQDFLQKKYKKNFLAVYMGDDTTDEDAFAVLLKGITIHVGRNRKSLARYFIKSRKDVPIVLQGFLQLAESHKNANIT